MPPQIVTLTEPRSGARAQILASQGFNCFALQLAGQGRLVDVLWSEEGFASGDRRASSSGIPLLFPFPGRIQGTSFHWQGKDYPLEAGDGRGNAIHGFVHTRPWRVLEQSDRRVVGQFHASLDDAQVLDHWPADFRLTATYELTSHTLTATFLIENPDDHPLPCGLGSHPYFRVPPGAAPSPDECLVQLPVRQRWELVDMIATGRRLDLDEPQQYQRGRRFGTLQLDDVFTDLVFEHGLATARVEDTEHGAAVVIRWDESFPHCVVYTPGHRQAICIEPYSCVPGAAQLAQRGIESNLWILEPGAVRQAVMQISLQ